ncbi:aminoacyl-tRNA hydrolase [Candidatus Ornithobacterium hominis]|uniref:aminoacyl-tRNA hydrolase n=1 Tax=Candidatus Ornithobacterium hominis TaxID=2497989 RepID=UPI0024BD5790|nr:aminoacyl-tRNA hydrolase [Candidatus Ornithobacterium hominis]CAI9428818.1 aminoacyl-tRNA hydrolase [Candidatus Ornithobacterium hominis]
MQKYLIVGLGNPGQKYEKTRHNIGFLILNRMAEKACASFENGNFGEILQFKYKARPVVLLKPNTFMNLSGNAVQFWMKKENINLENLLVVTDDLNLPFGTLRLRGKGSDGGHNGLKHIQQVLNTTKYPKLRFGIGDEFSRGQQIDYVLGEWSDDENLKLNERVETAAETCFSFIFAGLANTMNQFNGK